MNKFKGFKKLAISFLAFAMVMVSIVPVALVPASAASSGKEVTIYFQNNKNWKNVYAYLWVGSGNVKGTSAWPGTQMTKVSGTDNWYEMKFTPSSAFNVIFNDNGQPKPQQTANHTPKDLTSDKSAYWFVPTDTSETNNNNYTATGLAIKVYTEAQSGFPTPKAAATDAKPGNAKTSSSTTKNSSKKDNSPQTGDNSESMPIILTVALASLAGIGILFSHKKAAA